MKMQIQMMTENLVKDKIMWSRCNFEWDKVWTQQVANRETIQLCCVHGFDSEFWRNNHEQPNHINNLFLYIKPSFICRRNVWKWLWGYIFFIHIKLMCAEAMYLDDIVYQFQITGPLVGWLVCFALCCGEIIKIWHISVDSDTVIDFHSEEAGSGVCILLPFENVIHLLFIIKSG